MGYRKAVEWIALNDDMDIGEEDTGFILTVCMVADLFNKTPAVVAKAVVACRKRECVGQ